MSAASPMALQTSAAPSTATSDSPAASPVYRSPHHHQHHHHSADARSPMSASSSHAHSQPQFRHHYRRSPPSYADLTLTHAPSVAVGHHTSRSNNNNNNSSGIGGVQAAGATPTPTLSLASPWSSPSQERTAVQHHGRYRSSLPVPPPLRSLPTPTGMQPPPSSSDRQQPPRQRYAEPSRRRGLPPPLSLASALRVECATSSPTQSSIAESFGLTTHPSHNASHPLAHDDDDGEEACPSTPVDQRIPAMVPPSYDTYNLDGPAHGAPVYRGSFVRWGPAEASHHPPAPPLHHHHLTRTSALPSGRVNGGTEVAGLADDQGSPQIRARLRTHVDDARDSNNDNTDYHHRSQRSASPSPSEWRSPQSLAQAWRHVSSVDASALGSSADRDGTATHTRAAGAGADAVVARLPMASVSTPSTPACVQASLHRRLVSADEAAGGGGVYSSSTPRELCLPLSSSMSVAEGEDPTQHHHQYPPPPPRAYEEAPYNGGGRSGRYTTMRLITPEAQPGMRADASRGASVLSTPPIVSWGAAVAAATAAAASVSSSSRTAAAPSVFLSPSVMEAATAMSTDEYDDDHHQHPQQHRHTTAHLHYLRNADFLFAVDDDEDEAAAAAACVRTPVALPIATATTSSFSAAPTSERILSSTPRHVERPAHSLPAEASSVYCSPQLLRGSATTTPSSAAPLPEATRCPRSIHNTHNGNRHMRNDTTTTTTAMSTPSLTQWPASLFASPVDGHHHHHTNNNIAAAAVVDTREGWRSPLQWNPRQARDDVEMLMAKEVAEYAVAQHRCGTASSPTRPRSTTEGNARGDGRSVEALLSASMCMPPVSEMGGFRVTSRAFSTGDLSRVCDVSRDDHQQQQQQSKEEEEAEWIELLLHYRDRENEGSRIRHSTEDAGATAAAATATATTTTASAAPMITTSNVEGGARAAATLAWWATSPLMRAGYTNPRHIQQQQQQQERAVHRRTASAMSSVSAVTAGGARGVGAASLSSTFSPSSPPPAPLCAAMSEASAGRTIAQQVRRHVRQLREAHRLHVSSFLAARLPLHASKKSRDGLR